MGSALELPCSLAKGKDQMGQSGPPRNPTIPALGLHCSHTSTAAPNLQLQPLMK